MQQIKNRGPWLVSRVICYLLPLLVGNRLQAQNPAIQNNPEKKDSVIGGFRPTYGSDKFYILYVGVAYSWVKFRNGKQPYAASHTLGINYSPVLNSLHPYYEGFFPKSIGNWDLTVKAGVDGLRRMNFYGLGNETQELTTNNRFNWMRTRHRYASVGISREFARRHLVDFGLLFDGIKVLNDKNRFIAKELGNIDPDDFNWQSFVGGRMNYTYSRLNFAPFPTKGITIANAVSYTASLKRSGHSFTRYTTDIDAYFPLSSKLSLGLHGGAATLQGKPDFYQYNNIGGGPTLKGYRRWRFFGKTAVYNQNELRWLTKLENEKIYGHWGFIVHYDQGRVWMPGEESNKIHFGYGSGVIAAPFDKIWVVAIYSISNEGRRFHFGVQKGL